MGRERSSGVPEEMVLIPGGPLVAVIDRDTINVIVKPFLLDKYEVSIAEYESFVNATGYVSQSDRPGAKALVLGKRKIEEIGGVNWRCDERGIPRTIKDYHYPVVYVSFEDAEAYARWVGKRLPSIYEWQFAAMEGATESSLYSHILNSWHQGTTKNIQPGGLKEPNQYGLYDIFGNVGEILIFDEPNSSLPPGLKPENVSRSVRSSFFEDPEDLYPPDFIIGHKKGISFYKGFRCAKSVN